MSAALTGRVETIPYGVPSADEMPKRDASFTLKILYTGRLEEKQKRVSDLLAIAKMLQQTRVPFQMKLVGNGPSKKFSQNEIHTHGLRHCVQIVETIANERVAQFVAQADVFLLTSAVEGLSISLLEAMAQGCVPVVSDLPSGIPELIVEGVNGYRVSVGDIKTFAARLEHLQREVEWRARMSDAARATILENGYRVQDMTARYEKVIARVAGVL